MAAAFNLVEHIYTADPSAHVFEGKIYIYPSHDRETDIEFNDHGGKLSFRFCFWLEMLRIGKGWRRSTGFAKSLMRMMLTICRSI